MREFDQAVGLDGLHEGIGDADGEIEVGQVALVLGVDEILDVRMIAAQDAHLRAPARPGGFHGLAGAVEDAHVGDGAGGAGLGALHLGAARADGGEVVADAAAAAHGFGRLGQRRVDAGTAIGGLDDGVAHGLHKAVDQGRRKVGAGGGVDPPGRHEAVFLGPEQACFPVSPVFFRFHGGEGARHPAPHVVDIDLIALGIFLDQHLG